MGGILAVVIYWKVQDFLCKKGRHDMDRGGWRWRCCRNTRCDYAEEIGR